MTRMLLEQVVIAVVVIDTASSLYRDWATGWTTGVRFPAGQLRDFFSSPPRPDRLWGPPTFMSSGYWGIFNPGVKRPWREADYSPPSDGRG
jgi:hypothetical protein